MQLVRALGPPEHSVLQSARSSRTLGPPEPAVPSHGIMTNRADNDAKFDGTIPELYDRFLGPLLFEPFAVDLAQRIGVIQPLNVLEVAAGIRERAPELQEKVETRTRERLVERFGARAICVPLQAHVLSATR